VSVGNDVVDLDDPECRLDGLHPRWAERVFARAERAAVAAASGESAGGSRPWSARHRLHWALWAAKESAFKAKKRGAPATVFSPRELVVELAALPEANGVATGRVAHRGEMFTVDVRFDGACVHALAWTPDALSPILARVAAARDAFTIQDLTPVSAGDAARRLASGTLASALGLAVERLQVRGRPPVLLRDGEAIDGCVSLSHHGRFVAFAASLAP